MGTLAKAKFWYADNYGDIKVWMEVEGRRQKIADCPNEDAAILIVESMQTLQDIQERLGLRA